MYHTFYTISDLNYALFNYFVVFFLLTIKDKKYNVYNLIFLFSVLGTMAMAYFFSFGLVKEVWAYHRWITVGVSLVGTAQLTNYLLNYPEKKWQYLPKIVIFFHIVNVIVIIAFIYFSLNAPKVYQFDGHYWNVNLPFLSKVVGFLILILFILAFLFGLLKAFFDKKKYRVQILLMITGFVFVIFLPGLTNLLNRLYIIPRDFHQNFWVLSGILGTFLVLITYVNYTREKTTLLTKIYAISFATILFIVQFSSFFILRERERLFDENQNYKNGRIIYDPEFRPDELVSIVRIAPDLGINNIYNKNIISKDILSLISLEEIALQYYRLYKENHIENALDLIPENQRKWIRAYDLWFRTLIKKVNEEQAFRIMEEKQNQILLLRKLIRDLPDKNFQKHYEEKIYRKYKDHNIYQYFLTVIGSEEVSKQKIFKYIPILYKKGERIYRYLNQDVDFWSRSFVSYYYEHNKNIYYLIYKYQYYREFIHESAVVLFYIILASTFFIMISYPVFFYLSVLKPLKKLVHGLEEVDKGNFNVYLDVEVEDELGFVTRSFNQMVDSIREKNHILEEYANKLEQKVEERTRDLEKSLKEIESLKEKQDGDYFLTSLLLKPLNTNEVKKNDKVEVEFILKQFKEFQFRKWKSEIGGDFCGAYQIHLKGKEYVFMVNADAMGKSMQGAGGALVLGSVLEAIVERTQYQDEVKELYPEKWLKYTFVELHRVFESFDGSMLISAVLVLFDVRDGFAYFLNAEHPHLVLYHKGKARYIEPKKNLLKLGVSTDGLLEIHTLRLEPDDMIIVGSDGKDDLVLGKEGGVRKINHDEHLFLDVVEESKGNLTLMFDNLKERGEFMDDISMMSLLYKGDKEWLKKSRTLHKDSREKYQIAIRYAKQGKLEQTIEIFHSLKTKYPFNGVIKKRLGYAYIKMGEYRKGILELEEAFELLPWDTELLKMIVKGLTRLKFYGRAAEYGELYILRESKDKEMLQLLIDIYTSIKNPRAEKFKKILETINPVP